MRVLILNRYGLESIRYADWLEGCTSLALITSTQALGNSVNARQRQEELYSEIVAFDDYLDNPEVVYAAAKLHEKYNFDRIIAMSEYDILRAARLRDLLGVPGQGVQEASLFRDKVAMKSALSRADIPTAKYAPVLSVTDILQFVHDNGFPVVVKPRFGAGSSDVFIMRNEDELVLTIKAIKELRGDQDAGLIIEECIDNELYQVDGLIFDGEVLLSWPTHRTSTLAFQDGDICTAFMLDPSSPLRMPLQNMAISAMKALPTPAVTIFHVEIFLDREGGLLLNEVAARMSGGKTDASLANAFDLNFEEWYIRSVFRDQPWRLPRVEPKAICGEVLIAPRPGILAAAPSECKLPGVTGYGLSRSVGDRLDGPSSLGDFMAWLTVEAADGESLRSVLRRSVEWAKNSIRIDSMV